LNKEACEKQASYFLSLQYSPKAALAANSDLIQ